MMLPGFRSRWTIPALCAVASASAICIEIWSAFVHGNRVPANQAGANRDLKPPPAVAHDVLDEAAVADRSTADLAAACFSELVQDNNGNTRPTALHFTAGQQSFLKMVDELRRGVGPADLHEALLGPWTGRSTLPSLSWDATVARQYALRAGNPSYEKRGSIPAANWLGVIGLSFFPVTVLRRQLVTTRIMGRWKGFDALVASVVTASLVANDRITPPAGHVEVVDARARGAGRASGLCRPDPARLPGRLWLVLPGRCGASAVSPVA
jgi:hypothetical protein